MHDNIIFKIFNEMLEMGLEDLIRDEAKGARIKNWKTARIFPIVGMIKEVKNKPVVLGGFLVGIPEHEGEPSMVMMEAAGENIIPDKIARWAKKAMDTESGCHDCITDCLLSFRRAMVVLDKDLKDIKKYGWEIILDEVLHGTRSTNYRRLISQGPESIYQDIEIDFLSDFINKVMNFEDLEKTFGIKSKKPQIKDPTEDGGFVDSFKDEWA